MQPAQRCVFGLPAPKLCDQYKPISALPNDIRPVDQTHYFSRLYQFFNDVESKLAKFLQLIGTIKTTIFRKVRTETILKIYNTLALPTFLCGSENWTLTASQRRGIEASEMKLLRPLAGYTLYYHKTNDYIRRELQITGLLDKIDEYRQNWLAKNVTKLNPFEIIPLQTTRKENNWKTEEALARSAVTLETERIKGSNP